MALMFLFYLTSTILSLSYSQQIFAATPTETYIVHVSLPTANTSHFIQGWYHSFLPKTTMGVNDISRIVYSYRHVISGFAARLSATEVKEIEKKEGFIYARRQRVMALQTTHSPEFLGLQLGEGLWDQSKLGEGLVIGVIDNGTKPDHPSFLDEGVPSPPDRWKGKCHLNGTNCNKKLIGARKFSHGIPGLPIDAGKHGTYTASVAAGNFVKDANLYGNANGTAVGMAPRAHLAIYQACQEGCEESDVLAAMDAAIEDGVDVLSLSISLFPTDKVPFYEDGIAIGAFHAIKSGILVSCAAGNNGPSTNYIANTAPWILTVGASTIDRSIRATVVLGNKEEFDGVSLSQPKGFPSTQLPLVYGGQCQKGSLNSTSISGKVVLCETESLIGAEKGKNVKRSGGAAMILIDDEDNYECDVKAKVLPATEVSFSDGQAIKAYINSTSMPTATILFKGTVLGRKDAPEVASFSSRGPGNASPGILKPDIIGPGVSILAAWPISADNRSSISTFNIECGTSVACPHLSGIAALIRQVHPDWSPAAVKSAIMTSADILNLNNTHIRDERKLPADVFAIGAGHVNPSRAAHPGLVYDIQPDDYIPYLCGLGYTDSQISIIVQHGVTCSSISPIAEAELNYPSFAMQLRSNSTQTYTRTVTNVGKPHSSYRVDVQAIPGVNVHIRPRKLNFTKSGQRKRYQISFQRGLHAHLNNTYVEGAITWISLKSRVRSPISVKLI